MCRIVIGVFLIVAVAALACATLWPERLAVNAPVLGTLFGAEPPPKSELEARMKLPAGFSVGLFAQGISDARELHFTSAGDLLVSSPREGAVFLVEPDANGDGRADGVRKLLTGLESPQGLEIIGDWLYVAEDSGVKRVRLDPAARATLGPVESVLPGLPPGGNHWGKYIRQGPDGWIYLTIGSDCNVCIEVDRRRATIGRFKRGASDYETWSTGLRNSVGFDWRPADGAMYATENGRDLLGDDFPPCELNKLEQGKFYGWPFVNGFGVPDPDFGPKGGDRIAAAVPPAHGFGAHTAPLGMRFYRGSAFPERYRGQAFVALHGSWNRTTKSGYKVVLLEWSANGAPIVESDFLTGFEVDGNVIGRPVDVQDGPDGALYVSDDFAGAVYRVVYTGEGRARDR